MPYLLKRDFYFSANPRSFLLYHHCYLLSALRIYVSNRRGFVSHVLNVGTVFLICPYCIWAGSGANPSRDYCDTQLYLENPLSQHLALGRHGAGAGHPPACSQAVTVWLGRKLGLSNTLFPAEERLTPGVQRQSGTHRAHPAK